MSAPSEKLAAFLALYPQAPDAVNVWGDSMSPTFGHLRALLAERTWRPISEAPRDGQAVLVGHPDFRRTRIATWVEGPGHESGWIDEEDGELLYPTHFQLLPPPPEPV